MSTVPVKTRDQWLDTFRGMAIVLMVVGHVLGGLMTTPYVTGTAGFREVYDWIYSFHMPALFWASGLLMDKSLSSRGPVKFVVEKARTLMYPYLVWGILSQIIAWLAQGYVNTEYDPKRLWRMLYDPSAGMWFLYTLFLLSVVYGLFWRVPGRRFVFFLFTVAGFAAFAYLKGDLPPGLHQVSYFGIYLGLGLVMGNGAIDAARQLPLSVLLLIGIAGFTAMTVFKMVLAPEVSVGLLLALLGITGLFGISALVARVGPGVVRQFLALCGVNTLEIYMVHTYTSVPFRVGLHRAFGVNNGAVILIVATLGGLLGSLAVAWVAKRSPLRSLFRI
ncbi:MAG TPA: acyltransferase [Gemmatales bacterium]|nr:acyltransferase [Gemmatales bacterium]